MKKLYFIIALAVSTFGANAQVTIAQWTFDADLPAAMQPTTGSGTFTTIGGVEDNLTGGVMPAGNPSTGKAYSIKTFPEAGTASGTAGFQFNVNTANYSGITVTFDPRGSNTASKWQQYQYTVNGTTWIPVGNNGGALTNVFTTTPMVTVTLPADAGNNDNFGFRIVSIFDPAGTDYAAVGASSTYGPGGAWRIDNVTFSGTSLGVSQNAIAGLKVYPNPVTNGVLYITSDNNETKSVVIFDVLGKQVVKTSITDDAVNVSNLKGGVYIVKITEAGKTATRKLVIQ